MHVIHAGADHGTDASSTEWTVIDDAITRLAQQKGALDVEIGRWLLVAQRERVERKVGFGSFAEYVERRLGYDARTTHDRLRVARALEELPRLAALLRAGQRSWSAVRELTRVATPETEAEWVEASERMTVRQVESLVTGREPGARPWDARDPVLATRRLVVELSPDELADWQEAAEQVRREIGPAATNREVLRALVQRELGGRAVDKPGYQTAVTLCLGCERTWQRAGGELVEVAPEVGDCARCDCEIVGVVQVEEEGAGAHVGGAPSDEGAHVGGAVEVTRGASAHVGGPAEVTCDASAHVGGPDAAHGHAHVGDAHDATLATALRRVVARGGSRVLTRILSQAIGAPPRTMTPRLRAAIRTRDRGRCVVPGCNHVRFIDLHHQRRRADGGPNTLENVVSLCSQHHRCVHEGVLAIEGSPSTGLVFRHASGTLYGSAAAVAESR